VQIQVATAPAACVPNSAQGPGLSQEDKNGGCYGLDPEVETVLDGLCLPVKGLDPYSLIANDRIEEKDGMFLSGELPTFGTPPPPPPFIAILLVAIKLLSFFQKRHEKAAGLFY